MCFLKAVLRLFQAGFVAACLQLIAAALMTLIVFAVIRNGLIAPLLASPGSSAAGTSLETQSSILTGTYLILSLGAALTENRFTDFTAMNIRQLSHSKKSPNPNLAMVFLLILFWLCAAVFVAVALQTPKRLANLGLNYGWGDVFSVVWPGTMSVGAACFGANAHATMKALQW
jgi:hypothetical protein